MTQFIPTASPLPAGGPSQLFIALQNDLVFSDGGVVILESIDGFGEPPVRTIPLGTFDGKPISAAVFTNGEERFVALRHVLLSSSPEVARAASLAAQLAYFHKTNAFCGRCGAATADKAGERAKVCSTCELVAYPRVSPAMITLVHDGERLLLAHRPNAPFFALVAGFVESGETLEECVAREVMEEVGLEVSDITYFGSQPWPFPHQVMIGFFARCRGGEIKVDGVELDEARWFERTELPPLPPRVSIARRMIDAFVAGEAP